LALAERVVAGVEQREQSSFDERALETMALHPLDAPSSRIARVADLEDVQEVVFLRRRRRRDLDAPRSGHDVARVAGGEPLEVVAPERLPHVAQVWRIRQGSALERRRRPVAAAAPRAALLVA